MSRPLSLFLAAALAATTALSAAPAVAGDSWSDRGWSNNRGWDNDWNDGRRWGHNRRHRQHFTPGFSFSFGVPFPPVRAYYNRPYRDDCYRTHDGRLYCRAD